MVNYCSILTKRVKTTEMCFNKSLLNKLWRIQQQKQKPHYMVPLEDWIKSLKNQCPHLYFQLWFLLSLLHSLIYISPHRTWWFLDSKTGNCGPQSNRQGRVRGHSDDEAQRVLLRLAMNVCGIPSWKPGSGEGVGGEFLSWNGNGQGPRGRMSTIWGLQDSRSQRGRWGWKRDVSSRYWPRGHGSVLGWRQAEGSVNGAKVAADWWTHWASTAGKDSQ
jgi:hypothetical protein